MVKAIKLKEENKRIKDVITFSDGLPGLAHLKEYIILEPKGKLPFKYLQSVEDDSIALVVADPYLYLDEYSFSVYDDTIKELEIEDISDVLVICVVVIPKDVKKMTANFAAPILINVKTLLGKQIILENPKYKMRSPVYERYIDLISKGGA